MGRSEYQRYPFEPFRETDTGFNCIFKASFFLKRQQFFVVHTITPKAGLIGMTAAFLAGVKIRVHTFTGQVWVTRRGAASWVLKNIDRFFALLTTHAYADSASQREFLIIKKIISRKKIKTMAHGSISGVDLKRFKPDRINREKIRKAFAVEEDSVVILFLGRMNVDKGVKDLISAFVRMETQTAHLFLVGPDECGIKKQIPLMAGSSQLRIHIVDYTFEPETYMAAADIFCLPSYREGFGSVIIEAAACGLPSVASRIYGLTDAVVHGVTGFFFPPGDIESLHNAIVALVKDPQLRVCMGKAARNRAWDLFDQKRLTRSMVQEYLMLTQI
nr:glycosyltransferase family 4 protein [Desulfobacula sp.]